MSETAKCAGPNAPGRSIEHNGKTFTFVRALTGGALLALEAKLYDRARAALADMRDAYPLDEYLKRLDDLRAKYEDGYYALTSPTTQKLLKTERGAVLLLEALCGASESEVFELLTERTEEVSRILDEVIEATFPDKKTTGPKAKPPRRRYRAGG